MHARIRLNDLRLPALILGGISLTLGGVCHAAAPEVPAFHGIADWPTPERAERPPLTPEPHRLGDPDPIHRQGFPQRQGIVEGDVFAHTILPDEPEEEEAQGGNPVGPPGMPQIEKLFAHTILPDEPEEEQSFFNPIVFSEVGIYSLDEPGHSRRMIDRRAKEIFAPSSKPVTPFTVIVMESSSADSIIGTAGTPIGDGVTADDFGTTYSPPSIPAPSGAGVILGAAVFAGVRRRRY